MLIPKDDNLDIRSLNDLIFGLFFFQLELLGNLGFSITTIDIN